MGGNPFPRINSPLPQEGWLALILAAGKGRRMNGDKPKVCYLVGGVPLINRSIATLKNWGFPHILVVVGHRCEDVVNAVEEEFPDVNFILQEEQKGTGHAVKCACEFLKAEGFHGNLLIIAGDKIVDGKHLREMRKRFQAGNYELLIATSLCEGKSFGRIIRDEKGKVKAILESKGRENDFPPSDETNQSIYLVRAEPLYEVIQELTPDPYSGEEQFTDIVAMFYQRKRKMETYQLAKEDILTFNTPREWEEVEAMVGKVHFLSERKPLLGEDNLRAAGEWLALFQERDEGLLRTLWEIYGDADLIQRKIRDFSRLLEKSLKTFGGKEPVFLLRSPGKLNILGRHIDHRGGRINSIAIDREILMVVAPRKDDEVEILNLEERFPPRSFWIREEMEKFGWGDWEEIYPKENVDGRHSLRGDWVLYAKAAALRLQERFRDMRLKGFKALVWGDIPPGSGLSSSSALLVAFAEALCLVNGLSLSPEQLVQLCGEGEWFVGTRGGMGDHAGIKMGRLSCVNQFGFHPFSYVASAPLPKGYAFIFAYSWEEANKAGEARDIFNQRVACYEIGTHLLKRQVSAIQHLRDLHPAELGVSEQEVLRLLKSLPLKMRKEEVISLLGEEGEEILAKHPSRYEEYPLRGVCLFGVAECARSRRCLELLKEGDILSLAELINISHQGDRVARLAGKELIPHANDVSDEYLDYLIENGRRHAYRKEFSLAYQPGDYACSTPRVDLMVDLARGVEGVLAAQILGAGLGGSLMILAREEAVAALQEALIRGYYEPLALEPLMGACLPIEGAGCIRLAK